MILIKKILNKLYYIIPDVFNIFYLNINEASEGSNFKNI